MSLTRATPRILPVLDDLSDALAIEISREMRRREMRYCDLGTRFGYSDRRVAEISEYLRGRSASFGHVAALNLARKLGIPVRFEVGKPVPILDGESTRGHRDPFAARITDRSAVTA